MARPEKQEPRTFYLNEQHELTRGELAGGGALPQLAPVDWAKRGKRLSNSLGKVRDIVKSSKDPLRDQHYFLLAKPETTIKKLSSNKKKAPTGTFDEETNYSADHSRVFRRLGIDLLQVNDDGTATVHTRPERLEQLIRTTESLGTEGAREQSRWVALESFDVIPISLRIDQSWLNSLQPHHLTDAIIELQPLLTRVEVDTLLRSIGGLLRRDDEEKLTGTGTDFSGRQWLAGRITRESLQAIAKLFFSVQSLHSPLLSLAAATSSSKKLKLATPEPAVPTVNIRSLPCVAVLDAGVPADHLLLGSLRRGQYYDPSCPDRPLGDHGSFVASRLVFGDPDYSGGLAPPPAPTCSYYDVMVSIHAPYIYDKSVVPSMTSVVGTAPDVRVFNLSFDSKVPLTALNEVERRERMLLVQDLDNFIFASDVLVIVAAGNSPTGIAPTQQYPEHANDPQWGLGTWSQSFNSLTCGSYVGRLSANGMVKSVGWPSPFTRLGPGMCDSPKPDFAAHGGNMRSGYQGSLGCGVWGLNGDGRWEDKSGTSYATPLLAREAAHALRRLQNVCVAGARPYACTVKAFLALTAAMPTNDEKIASLAQRAFGYGVASAGRLITPLDSTAVLLWQGVLESPSDVCRIELPIPKSWRKRAEKPHVKLVVAWESPVNSAAKDLWASRSIRARLRAGPEVRALRSSTPAHQSYTILNRLYDLNQKNADSDDDSWILEVNYEQIADYYPAYEFSPQQRVAFAAELFDLGDNPESPQAALQGLPVAHSMTRLSIPPTASKVPVILTTKL